ncbi:hypothetical protein ASA1KI_44160 [Opitutales bacterium ASA1]|uniref:endo-1,4-beta-xylanase n=1 Tax=Congregicoccus parvus TaxID=3081749 RepID=UPI002B2E83C3|nr:hypothetical protein ASA1KI_44160 [Opitutales bacterium ASA1]
MSAAFIRKFSLLLAVLPIAFASAQGIPSGGLPLVDVADVATLGSFYSNTIGGQVVATRTIVPVSGQPFAQAARIDVQAPNGDFWTSAISAQSNRPVADGDVVLLHLFLRAIASQDETGSVSCYVFAEGPAPEYVKSTAQTITAGPEWIEYFIPFTIVGNHAAGSLGVKLGLGLGTRPQTFEIGGVRALWYGTARTLAEMPRTSFRYEGREADAPWRAEAAARIERHRKADYRIRVVNTAGIPVEGATVRATLRRHAFEFGTALDAARIVDQSTADNRTYREKFLELFNAGTFGNDLKWPPWEGNWGPAFNRNQTLAALAWLTDEARVPIRGHVLVWPSDRNLPNSIKALLPSADASIPQRVRDHITDIVDATSPWVHDWDVLNEPYDNFDLMSLFGQSIMADWFIHARSRHPTARLFINDYGILSGSGLNVTKQDAYAATIRRIRDDGGPLGGIGFQGHFDTSPTSIPRVWSILERYAQEFTDAWLRVTEFDVDTDDEQLQADYIRDFLTIAFSHPRMIGIQTWGFWEGAHWRPRAAILRADWSEKPGALAHRELVHGAWKTDETRHTAIDGRVAGRGFHGEYDIVVTHGASSATLPLALGAEGAALEVVLDVPLDTAPRITRQPFGATVAPGQAASISLETSGSPTPFVQWYKNDAPFASGTDTLEFPAASAADDAVYRAVATNAAGSVSSRPVRLGVLTPAERIHKLVNISTRGNAAGGDEIMIAGFVVGGTGTKDVLVRGVGPQLGAFGVPGTLTDPAIRVFRAGEGASFAADDDWSPVLAPVFDTVGAFPLDDDTKSAALRLDLAPGGYTVHLASTDGARGRGIVEVYDVAAAAPLELVNISTRGLVGAGDDVLIGGFVVSGETPRRVLVRGIGPELATFGVGGVLEDPHLVLYEVLPDGSNRRIAWNEDWFLGDSPAEVVAVTDQVGAFPLRDFSRDAVLLLWLEPGVYSVHLAGADTREGIGMIEMYSIP